MCQKQLHNLVTWGYLDEHIPENSAWKGKSAPWESNIFDTIVGSYLPFVLIYRQLPKTEKCYCVVILLLPYKLWLTCQHH